MVEAYTYGDDALVEYHVSGTEISVGVLDVGKGPAALAAVEIEPVSGSYDYEARYNAGETRFYTPARISPESGVRAADLALLAHRALGLRHLSRVDMIVDPDGTPWFLEVNVLPGLTETSLLPQAILSGGGDLGTTYAALARAAISTA
jgi:D-alanine-D-alanine ligase